MEKNKILKLLEKLMILVASLLMITVLANKYVTVSNMAIGINLRLIQIILIAIAAIITLIMTFLDNKKVSLILFLFYLLMIGLFFIFKNAGRI